MVTTFSAIQLDLSAQMKKHEDHLSLTTKKFQSVDKRVDVDMESTI